jgi:hypothetical protein
VASVIEDELDPFDNEVEALIRAYVACRVAMDALPDLPAEVVLEIDDAVTRLCHAVGPALEARHPGFFDR